MQLIMELIIGALLVATCGYCIVLSRKLKVLREGQAELLDTIEKFDAAARRSERNLETMQGSGAVLNRDLAEATRRANALVDELSVMVHAGDNIAGRLEGAVNEVRQLGSKSRKLAS